MRQHTKQAQYTQILHKLQNIVMQCNIIS